MTSHLHPVDAVVYRDAGQVELRQFELPPPGEDELVVATHYTMVSTGTELRVLGGHYGAKEKFPLIPGYSFVGEVTAIGDGTKGWRVGDLVTAGSSRSLPGIASQWGGQASAHVCSASACVPLPAGARTLDYAITEVAAISWRGAEAAQVRPGEIAVVIGQGLIGAFSAAWLHLLGARVIVLDVAASRLDRAMRWGAAGAVNAREPDAVPRVRALCPAGADIVVESSGTTVGLRTAHALVGRDPWTPTGKAPPRLVLQANYLDEVSLNPFSFFDGEGLTLLTPIDRRASDREKVVEHIRRGRIDPAHFLDRVVPFHDAPAAYATLRDRPEQCFSLTFDWTARTSSAHG